jgi:hypothetical protein
MSLATRQMIDRPRGILSGEDKEFFRVPARESAYAFKVAVYCTRHPMRWRWNRQWLANGEELARVYEIIRSTVRQTGGEFSIFEPAAAEQKMNARLVSRLDGAERSDRSIVSIWTARAEVALPGEVLALMRKTVDEEYEIWAKAKATTLRMEKTEELRAGWDRFLDDAAKSRNAHHAVELVEDPRNVARVLEAVLNDRRKGAEDLLTLINKIVEAERSADILDLVVKSETVLRETLKMMGIELPEMDAGTLLAPLEDGV